jgi:hypothetical protein
MATKSYEKLVKDMYPEAEYSGMGISGFTMHTIWKSAAWKREEILGQSSIGRKQAWQTAYENMKTPATDK